LEIFVIGALLMKTRRV